jgi:predicted membrane protein
MCLLIASAIMFAAFNFYENGFITQAIMSAVFALIIFSFFTYRMIKNRNCIFGDKSDCNKKQTPQKQNSSKKK